MSQCTVSCNLGQWVNSCVKSLQELVNNDDPGFPLVKEWMSGKSVPVEFLPPSAAREELLLQTQVTTRSPMGAIVYETGGILVDGGWLRILGSGHPRLTRTLPGWNAGRSTGFWLVADDAVGGFYAINGGAIGETPNQVYYFAPDALRWESLEFGYSQFLGWAVSDRVAKYYEWIRWPGWQSDVAQLHGDRCYFFAPPLFTKEGKGGIGRRTDVPVHESWGFQEEIRERLDGGSQ